MKRFLYILLFSIIGLSGISQEIITELQGNPVIKSYRQVQGDAVLKSLRLDDTPLTIPFFDDFNSKDLYPASSRWIDKDAFVNTDYALFPPNSGVATLDALNEEGTFHPNAIPGPQHFEADKLTSRMIRLDSVFDPFPAAIRVKDSVYFSFFYQPEGRGNAPESLDSLILEFAYLTGDTVFSHIDSIEVVVDKVYYPEDTILLPCPLPDDSIYVSALPYMKIHNAQLMLIPGDIILMPCDSVFIPEKNWMWVWSSEGESLDSNFYTAGNPLTYFRQVMIPVLDSTKFYTNHFQFRFRNYVSLADNSLQSWQSNMDQWNLDFVYLNMNRRIGDTTYKAITFVDRAPSLLNAYESMPYSQYKSDPISAMKDTLTMIISNLDIYAHNTNYTYYISGSNGSLLDSCDQGNWDIPPVWDNGYLDYQNFARPKVCFGFYPLLNSDSAVFTVTHRLATDPGSFDKLGDTISYVQKMYNYYAYDDGTPEAGYGLSPSGSQLAMQFTLNQPDTLRAIQIYFNKTLNETNEQYFFLTVYSDNNGKPGNVIHTKEGLKPGFANSLDELYTYYLDTIVPVVGTFYVGLVQTTNDNLNIGFDRYNDAHNRTWFNVDGTWNQSVKKGAVMIRPVVGRQIHEYPIPEPSQKSDELIIKPNPIKTGQVRIELPVILDDPYQSADYTMNVYSITGQIVYSGNYEMELSVTDWGNGIYIVIVNAESNNNIYKGKLVVLK